MSDAAGGNVDGGAAVADAGAGAGAGGGAAELLAGAGAANGGEGTEGGAGGTGGETEGGAPWYGDISDTPPADGVMSNKAWLDNKKFSDLSGLIKAARESEKQLLAGDKIIVPKEGDAPEVFDNFYKALGRPDEPNGYEIPLPEGRELDDEFASTIRDAAFKAGAPASMLGPIAEAFNAHIIKLEQNAEAEKAASQAQGMQEIRSEWGDKFNTNVSYANQAMKMLGLDAEKIGKIEDGLGTAETMKLLSKLGAGMGEDVLGGGGGSPQAFGVTPAAAREELKNMQENKELRQKVLDKDPATVHRRQMLQTIVARDEERQAQA